MLVCWPNDRIQKWFVTFIGSISGIPPRQPLTGNPCWNPSVVFLNGLLVTECLGWNPNRIVIIFCTITRMSLKNVHHCDHIMMCTSTIHVHCNMITTTNILKTHSCDHSKLSKFVMISLCRLLVRLAVCYRLLAMWAIWVFWCTYHELSVSPTIAYDLYTWHSSY